MFFGLLFGDESKYLAWVDRELRKEISDFREVVKVYNVKLKSLNNFAERIDRQRNFSATEKRFDRMKGCFLSVGGLESVINKRDQKGDKRLVSRLDKIEEEDRAEGYTIESLKQGVAKLLQIRRMVSELVRRELGWFKENPSFRMGFKREDIQPLARLVKREGDLLFENGLSGSEGEREVLIGIYNQVMPLRDRIKREKIGGGRATTAYTWTWMDGRIRVVKQFGSFEMGRRWSYEQAKKRLASNREFYAFLKEADVSVPDHNSLYIMEQWKKTPTGPKPTGYYQAVLNQEHVGKNMGSIFRETNSDSFIIRLFNITVMETYKAVRANPHWMLDFKPQNFCWDGKKVTFVDIETLHMYPVEDPVGKDFIVRTDLPVKEQLEGVSRDIRSVKDGWTRKDWIWWRFKRADSRGVFVELLEQSVALKIALKDRFEQEILRFFKKHGCRKELRFMNRYLVTPLYEFNLYRLVKQEAPEDLAIAEEVLKRKERAKGFTEKL
jgi:hypothetical protein|tara:strand:- start:57 stop:1544 length:1488 start_codon:yes stop_codon:yes gene_type:complete